MRLNWKKIIWRPYKNNEKVIENINDQRESKRMTNSSAEKGIYESLKISVPPITEIEPFLPLNNFLDYGNFQTSIRWKSSFEGGHSGGTGQQNPSFVFDYGFGILQVISIFY